MTSPENTKPKRKPLKKWQITLLVIFALFILASLTGGNTSTNTPTTNTPTASSNQDDEQENSNESVSQSNAVKKAKSYLSYSAFSRSGLIAQLEFEGFNTSDATYGTDAQNADWNDQAAKKGKSYLDMSGYSRSGLIDQLEFEGFTTKEAAFGASANGL
jgi:cytoskeletal protein RodZ